MPEKMKSKVDRRSVVSAATLLSQLQPRTNLSRKAFIKEIVKSYGNLAAEDCGDCADCSDCASSMLNLDELINPVP